MREFWLFPAKCAVQENVFWCGWKPFLASDDVCDFHEVVVDDIREMICWESVGFHENLVVDDFSVELDSTADQIFKFQCFVWDALADYVWFAGGDSLAGFFRRDFAAFAIVHCRLLVLFLSVAKFVEAFLCTETIICRAFLDEFVSVFSIYFEAL